MNDVPVAALNGSLEENVLAALCWHDELAPLIASRLDERIFSDRDYTEIARLALAHLRKYNRPIKVHLADELKEKIENKRGGNLIREAVSLMQMLAPHLNPQYIIDQLDRFIELRRTLVRVEQAADALHDEDLEKAQTILHDVQPTAIFDGSNVGTWLHDPAQSLRSLDRGDDEYFSSGIEALDERDVQPTRRTLMLMLGAAKSGKSWYLISVGKAALLHRKSVLHITLENSEELTARRYVQCMFGMTKRQAQPLTLSRIERTDEGTFATLHHVSRDELGNELIAPGLESTPRKELNRRVAALKRRKPLLIKEFPTGQLTLTQLDMYLEMLKRIHKFEPDVLIVDYPDLMALDANNLRVSLGRLITGLRGICVSRNMAGVAVSQVGRVGFLAQRVHAGMVAEDFSKIGTADTILSYSQTPNERECGLARVAVEAARDAADKFIVLITQHYMTGQFCLDSVYFDKMVEQTKMEFTGEDHGHGKKGRDGDDDGDGE